MIEDQIAHVEVRWLIGALGAMGVAFSGIVGWMMKNIGASIDALREAVQAFEAREAMEDEFHKTLINEQGAITETQKEIIRILLSNSKERS